jgi:ABC-2 type transport system ATP-binding protein
MDEAGRCDHLLLMREGRLLADLTPGELREHTGEHDMEQAFLRLIEREEAVA